MDVPGHKKGTFSERLQTFVDEAGSQSALAKRIVIAQQNISNWINGGTPHPKIAEYVAARLGVNVRWLLHGEGPRTEESARVAEDEPDATTEVYRFIRDHGTPDQVAIVKGVLEQIEGQIRARRRSGK